MSRRSSTGSEAKLLHFDAFSGIAGNMVLGALVDLGVPRRALEEELSGLGIDFRFRISRVSRGALAARHLDVLVPKKGPSAWESRNVEQPNRLMGSISRGAVGCVVLLGPSSSGL